MLIIDAIITPVCSRSLGWTRKQENAENGG